jgi:hypothetical protein
MQLIQKHYFLTVFNIFFGVKTMKVSEIKAFGTQTKSAEQLRIDSLKKQKELVGDRLKQEKKRQRVSKAQQQLAKAQRLPTT